MQIEELYDLTYWITKEIVKTNIVQHYTSLFTILNQNAQPNTAKVPFEEQRKVLLAVLSNVETTELSIEQMEILAKIGIANNVGQNGVSLIEDTLYKNALDIASAVKKLQTAINEINNGINWSNQLSQSFSSIIDKTTLPVNDNEVIIRLRFTKDAHMSNITEFRDWGKIWYEISRGVTIVNNEAPENINIVGASNGSIILALASTYGVAKTLGMIITEALKLIDRVFDIKKKAEEIRALKLANDQVEKSLLQAADKERELGIQGIIRVLSDEYKLDKSGQGDKANELTNAIKKLIDFIEKGGDVDFVVPENSTEVKDNSNSNQIDNEQREQLREMFKEVHRLESKIKLLEDKSDKSCI